MVKFNSLYLDKFYTRQSKLEGGTFLDSLDSLGVGRSGHRTNANMAAMAAAQLLRSGLAAGTAPSTFGRLPSMKAADAKTDAHVRTERSVPWPLASAHIASCDATPEYSDKPGLCELPQRSPGERHTVGQKTRGRRLCFQYVAHACCCFFMI